MKAKLFLSAIAMTMFVSCEIVEVQEIVIEPDNMEDTPAFSAFTEREPQTRTAISDYSNSSNYYSLNWVKGDEISISDGTNTATFVTDDDGSNSAVFTCKTGNVKTAADTYEAFYPSSITPTNMVLPATRNYVENNVEEFPMYAVSESKDLDFKNLCGIIRFSIKSDETGSVNISKISMSSDNLGMSGKFTIGKDNSAVVKGTDGIVLSCTDPVPLYNTMETDFNIIVPKGSYNPLKVKVVDENGKEINLESQSPINVKRSGITKIRLTLNSSTFDSSLEKIQITESDVEFTDR